MFIDPIIMQLPEGIDAERFVIATYYCAAKPTTNMVKFAAALAIEQTCGTWLKVPGETPEVRERAIGRVVGVYEAPAYPLLNVFLLKKQSRMSALDTAQFASDDLWDTVQRAPCPTM